MEYIIVVGGGMSNKGAQSMVFQIVSEMKKRFPQKKTVALIDMKPDDAKSMNTIYNFEIVPFGIRHIFYLYGKAQTILAKVSGTSKNDIMRIKEILKNACLAFDVSGYSLSSNWIAINSIKYLYQIAVLKKYGIPTILMPQSFGPFDYGVLFKHYIKRIGRKLLSYPVIIFAREQYSYESVKNFFHLSNVCLSKDMVLTGKEVEHSSVLCPEVKLREFCINKSCVAVVPNNKLAEKFSLQKTLAIYKTVINTLIECNRDVYIIQHSGADIDLCIEIKNCYPDNPHITLLQENLNCLEYDLLIRLFDYIIASRYHSLVHAYRQNVPCIAIGWSEKYDSLMNVMGQSEYMINAKNLNESEIPLKIAKMQENYRKEQNVIYNFFAHMNENIYDKIFSKLDVKE